MTMEDLRPSESLAEQRAKLEMISAKPFVSRASPASTIDICSLQHLVDHFFLGHLRPESYKDTLLLTDADGNVYSIRRKLDANSDTLIIRSHGSLHQGLVAHPSMKVVIPTNMPTPYLGSIKDDTFYHGRIQVGSMVLLPSRFDIDTTKPCSRTPFLRRPVRQPLTQNDLYFVRCKSVSIYGTE